MSIEADVLSVLLNEVDYKRYREAIELHALSDEGKIVLQTIDSIRTSGQQPIELSPEDLRLAAVALNPGWNGEDRVRFNSALERLTGACRDGSSFLLKTWVEREAAAALADKADRFIESPGTFKEGFFNEIKALHDKLKEDLQKFETIDDREDFDTSLTALLEELDVHGNWMWRLGCFNRSLGPVYPGQLIVMGGRPEAGKTTLVCSEIAHLSTQMSEGSMVVFFNNETHGKVLRLRSIQSVIGWPTKYIRQRTAAAQKAYDETMQGKEILIKDVHGGSLSDVDRVLDKYGDRVKLIVFDQAGKLNGYEDKNGNNANRLQKLAAHLKVLAAHVAPVITTWWCSGDAEGEQYIGMDQLNDSKTGVPGEAEVVLTIGKTDREEDEGTRYLNIPKNKSLSCPDEGLRHSKWIVKIDAAKARFTD